MIQSMTGYGKAGLSLKTKIFWVEIRSVNSKLFDLTLHVPNGLKSLEPELRKVLPKLLERGKVDLRMGFEKEASAEGIKINKSVVKKYHAEFNKLAKELNLDGNLSISQLISLPKVFNQEDPSLSKSDISKINKAVKEAIQELLDFRKWEGKALEKDIVKRIKAIEKGIKKTDAFEKRRITRLRAKLSKHINQNHSIYKIDNNRFEQEIIYYLEKLDVTEEKIRLAAHCSFFQKTAKSKVSSGKKLNFIAQEIGREINTLGSKANDAVIQKIVVEAKDDLEKIKEQLYNVL